MTTLFIVVLLWRPVSATIEFYSMAACDAARQQITQEWEVFRQELVGGYRLPEPIVYAACLRRAVP